MITIERREVIEGEGFVNYTPQYVVSGYKYHFYTDNEQMAYLVYFDALRYMRRGVNSNDAVWAAAVRRNTNTYDPLLIPFTDQYGPTVRADDARDLKWLKEQSLDS